MKFVPLADRNMSTANKQKISTRLRMHTTMKGNQVIFPTAIKDPDMTLECLEGKTVGEAVLQIMTKDKKNPLFRHFKKDWHRDIAEKSFSLVAHSVFEKEARQCAYTLKNYMINKYGDSILAAFTNGTAGLNNPHDTYDDDSSDFEFDIEDDKEDKFINKTVQVTNMDMVTDTETTKDDTINNYKEENSAFTGMDKTMIHSNASDKSSIASKSTITARSVHWAPEEQNQSSDTDGEKSSSNLWSMLSDLSTKSDDIVQSALDNPEIKSAIEKSSLEESLVKGLLLAFIDHTGSVAADEAGKGP